MNNPLSATEAVLVTKRENLIYLTGFDGEGFVVLTAKKKYLCTDQRYWIRAKKVKGFELIDRAQDVKKTLRVSLKSIMTFLFEEETLSVAGLKRWRRILPGKQWKPGKGYVEHLRLVKSTVEMRKLQKAGRVANECLVRTLKQVRAGKTELDIKRILLRYIAESEAQGPSFDPIIAFGENAAVPHHVSTTKKLTRDDVVLIDMGVKYADYCSDMTRTFFIGHPRPEIAGMFELVRAAQKEASMAVRAGVRIRYLDEIARSVMGEEAQFFTHSLGHGVGLEVHENPSVAGKNDQLLEEGMVVTIEPGIYKEGIGGVRIEDTLLVTKKGSTNLTPFPKHPDIMRYR